MWCLCDDLKLIVLDYLGDLSLLRHRQHRFCCAEIISFVLMCKHWERPFRPSFIRRVEGFKEVLQLAYLHPQDEPLLKSKRCYSIGRP